MPHCLVSFGSNLGDRMERIRSAAQAIAAHEGVGTFVASRLYETPPIGGPLGQEPFLNGVARIETSLGAVDVLKLLQEIELNLGRQRFVRWDSRSIDLDVVLYGDLLGENPRLAVPHPRFLARRFVLLPAAEIAPQWRDPRIGWTVERLALHLQGGVPSLALVGGTVQTRLDLCRDLHARHGIDVFLDPSQPIIATGRPWVSAFLPALPVEGVEGEVSLIVPRLVAHLQWTTPESRWPAVHQLWQGSLPWPEYRLEIDSHDWAVSELASALDSMGCPLTPVTLDGLWYL